MIIQEHIHIPCTGLGIVIAPYNMPTAHIATISIHIRLNTFITNKFKFRETDSNRHLHQKSLCPQTGAVLPLNNLGMFPPEFYNHGISPEGFLNFVLEIQKLRFMKHFIELLLNHLDSLSLLVGIIFFFIRELYKLSIRKKELKFKTFYSNSVNSISEFLDSFLSYKAAMRNINLIDILNGQTDILELNKIAYEPLIDMKNKNLKLHFYLDKELYEKYDSLVQSSSLLYDELRDIIYSKDLPYPDKINKYEEAFTKFEETTENFLIQAINESQKMLSNHKEKRNHT